VYVSGLAIDNDMRTESYIVDALVAMWAGAIYGNRLAS
jgi:hypothetical protein